MFGITTLEVTRSTYYAVDSWDHVDMYVATVGYDDGARMVFTRRDDDPPAAWSLDVHCAANGSPVTLRPIGSRVRRTTVATGGLADIIESAASGVTVFA